MTVYGIAFPAEERRLDVEIRFHEVDTESEDRAHVAVGFGFSPAAIERMRDLATQLDEELAGNPQVFIPFMVVTALATLLVQEGEEPPVDEDGRPHPGAEHAVLLDPTDFDRVQQAGVDAAMHALRAALRGEAG